MTTVNAQLLHSPLPTLLQQLGEAIAETQFAMDERAAGLAQRFATTEVEIGAEQTASLLELGFVPSFYHLSSATLEARVAFSSTESREISAGVSVGGSYLFFSAQVNASYTNKYSFHAEGSSSIVANFVSVPPPAALQDRLTQLRTP